MEVRAYRDAAVRLALRNVSAADIAGHLVEKGCPGVTAGLMAGQVKKQVRAIVRREALLSLAWSVITFVAGILPAAWLNSQANLYYFVGVVMFGIIAAVGAVLGIVSLVFLTTAEVPASLDIYSFRSRILRRVSKMDVVLPAADGDAPIDKGP